MGVKLINRYYDAGGMSSGRMLRQQIYSKLRPLWCFSDELKVKHILALAVRQYLGYPITYLTLRFNPQWQKALNGWRRLRPPPRDPGKDA